MSTKIDVNNINRYCLYMASTVNENFQLSINLRPDFFLLVDLRDFFFRSRVEGTKKIK